MLKVLLLLASVARAAEGPIPPPVDNEPHGMKGEERRLAMHVLASHHRAVLSAFDLTLDGADRTDPSKPARCEMKVVLSSAAWREGTMIDGLPVRRGQPGVFNSFQTSVMSEVARCSEAMVFTSKTHKQLRKASLDLMLRLAGTTYCRKDEECQGYRLSDRCGAELPVDLYTSQSTDLYMIMFTKFAPALLSNSSQAVVAASRSLGEKHPDHASLQARNVSCAIPTWREEPLESSCVRNACQAR